MEKNLEEKINPKIAALVEYLELDKEQSLDISQETNIYFSYDNYDYLILTSEEVDTYLDNMSEDEIGYIQSALDYSDFEYKKFVTINEDLVRNFFSLDSISENYDEINNYYIFTL